MCNPVSESDNVINLITSTLAGSGNFGRVDGDSKIATFKMPCGVAIDAGGNVIVADTWNCKIRKISGNGEVTTIAGAHKQGLVSTVSSVLKNALNRKKPGGRDGKGDVATFSYPEGITVDLEGNIIVSDTGNHKLRKINHKGNVSTIAGTGFEGYRDGHSKSATFHHPRGIAVDVYGNIIIADSHNNKIRMLDTKKKSVFTVAGTGESGCKDGESKSVTFDNPCDVAIDSKQNIIVADTNNGKIRVIDRKGMVTTITLGMLCKSLTPRPTGVAIDLDDNIIISVLHNRILMSSGGFLSVLAGTGEDGCVNGVAKISSFNSPHGVTIDQLGNIVVADTWNHVIRIIGRDVEGNDYVLGLLKMILYFALTFSKN